MKPTKENKERKQQKERVDKTKNKIKVMKELLKNPLQTEREIAKNANISKSSAHNHAKDIGQT
jgi:predicted transcriptional regulator